MATIVLSAVGMAAGASVGGGVLGLSSAVIGRAIGATLGRVIDQRLMGAGSEVVETGRVDRFRLTGASEGTAIAQIYGRSRVAGQVIWASRFKESSTVSGGGKGAPSRPKTREYSYSVSVAIALCEGEISRVGRIWADGQEVARDDLNMRVYSGAADQTPDPKIEAVEGTGAVPAYRGTAYVVFEDLDLGQFGNRLPQFTFEVVRPSQAADGVSANVRGVALIPGTGEYALATSPVYVNKGPGNTTVANVHSPSGKSDFSTSIEALAEELPNCGSVSLVVSWFGDDLRCDRAQVQPKVEQTAFDGRDMPWVVSGLARSGSATVPVVDDRPVYGGTPADMSVIEAIRGTHAQGRDVMFYPFILMDQIAGNGLTDPWNGSAAQPALPWRGRMTLSVAPGFPASPDQTAAADTEVAAFFGAAQVSDFSVSGDGVSYSGPQEWSYRRFILHYAHLCAAAGGVESFCIGSEMRGLTQIRGAGNSFPAVAAMRALAADVRVILGAATKIGYAADWSEYFGYQPQDGSGDVLFNLDPLWADPAIDFIGIDNYMPMSDWRDGPDHADAEWGSVYNLDYLKANIAGGEGYDWYYANANAEKHQLRSPIEDGGYGEPWVYRYKDLKGWWSNTHHERVAGSRQASPTVWVPGSKPIWFTEFGCAAVNKGTNQPNKFLDPKSSESSLPKYSDGRRDDFIQAQYLRAMWSFWGEEANNPVSPEYGGPMVDMGHAHVWAWDARPYPFFPLAVETWSDGENYYRGHWLNGRSGARSLADVVAEIAKRSGVEDVDVSGLYGVLRGYTVDGVDGARAALQPLMLAYGFEAIETEGRLVFRTRRADGVLDLTNEMLADLDDLDGVVEQSRAPEAEVSGRGRLNFIEADGDYAVRAEEAIFPDETSSTVASSEVPLLLTGSEGRGTVERWLAESRVARETARFALPPSAMHLGAGDLVRLPQGGLYRIDRVSQGAAQICEAVHVNPRVNEPSDAAEVPASVRPFAAPVPVHPVFMDLPLLTGDEEPHAPHLAVMAQQWPGSVAVYSSASDNGYALNTLVERASVIGVTETPLAQSQAGVWDKGPALRVRVVGGNIASATVQDVLNGANSAAIGDGSADNWEVFQFERADLVGDGVYDLTGRLRGQAGTDALTSLDWPVGSTFVLLNGAPSQIDLPSSARGLARHYRIGSARRPMDDPSYVNLTEAFDGIGLRPYAPVHLRVDHAPSGDLAVGWVRRSRIDADSWASLDVPLGEDAEQYTVQVLDGSTIVREATTLAPTWTYSAAARALDGIGPNFAIQVAQVSTRFGNGLFRRIDVNV